MMPITQIFGSTLIITASTGRIAEDGQLLIPFLTFLALGTGVLVLCSFVLTRIVRMYLTW